MKKLKSSAGAKIIALLLAVVTLGLTVGAVLGIGVLESYDAYAKDLSQIQKQVLEGICTSNSFDVVYNFTSYYDLPESVFPDSGFCFTIEDSDGKVVYDNLEGRATICESEPVDFFSCDAFFANSAHITYVATENIDGRAEVAEAGKSDKAEDEPSTQREQYTLKGYILEDIPDSSELFLEVRALSVAYSMRYSLFAIAAVSFVLFALMFVFLMAAAGHHRDSEAIRGTFIEKLPFDLYTAAMVFMEVMLAYLVVETLGTSFISWMVKAFMACTGAALFVALGILWCMSWSVRLKMHTALKSCWCYKLLAWLWRGVKKLFSMLITVIKGIPLIPRAAVITAGVLLLEFIIIVCCHSDGSTLAFWWFVERAILVTLLLYALIGMKKLLAAGKEIAAGNLSYEVDTSKMRGVVKEHGEDLNHISIGLNKAVAERMKSERMKTELITNVSHDIRTPLTSIINYVDLLSKDNIDESTEREYIDVLERQSAKLKKLIDDLIEASKASSGSLSVNSEKCEMNVFLGQMAGEYAEKLNAAGLELVQSIPEESVFIMADGRHMWRIFDNLLNNACKYSQSGTRVYLELSKRDGKALVSLKNISKTQLNISGDELMERFVRGDDARNTEGSGLGLSIAKSLVQLQKGEMNISVDGDLFKVTLSFPTV